MAKKTAAKRQQGRRQDGPAKKSAAGQEGQGGEVRLLLRRRQGRRRPDDEGPARRQGLRPRRDDQRRPAGAPGLHDHDRGLQPLLRARAQGAGRRRAGDGGEPARSSRRWPGQQFGSTDEPAARVGPLGREVLDARHDGHDPQPRPERRDGRGAEGPDRQRPVRLRQLPPLHADVRQRRARDPEGRVREGVRRRQAREGREARHRPRRAGAARGREALQGVVQAQDRQGVPAGSDGAAARRAQRRVPLVEQPPRQGIPPHLRHPRPHRHGGQRAADGVRQHAATGRPPASASPATRRPARRSSTASS